MRKAEDDAWAGKRVRRTGDGKLRGQAMVCAGRHLRVGRGMETAFADEAEASVEEIVDGAEGKEGMG